MTLGFVDDVALPRDGLDRRLAALRSGPRASLLPAPGTAEDRQLTRWVAQVLLIEALCEAEAAIRGLPPAGPIALTPRAAVELGSIAAAAFDHNGYVRAVYNSVAHDGPPPRPQAAQTRYELQVSGPGGVFSAEPSTLPLALTRATPGETVMVEGAAFTVIGSHEVAIATKHDFPGPRLAFVRWLDHARAHRVRLVPGLEHPGDPGQPDNHHRH